MRIMDEKHCRVNNMKYSEIELPSNKIFGVFFAAVFGVLCGYFYWSGSARLGIAMAVVSAVLTVVAMVRPVWLLPLNTLWMRFGWLLGAIVSPLVLGILFFLLFTPLALMMRLSGRDELRIKKQSTGTHWKPRQPGELSADSFKNQF